MPDDAYRKQMVVCTPFGDYENGDQVGTMNRPRLRRIAERYRKYRRQVPIFIGEHVDDLDGEDGQAAAAANR